MPEEARKISEITKLFYPKAKTIVDCTANIGGNTINFAKHFKNVTSIEIDPETKSILENNVKLYRRENVKIILGDYVDLKDKIKGDIFFFDPPWGGFYYKMESKLDLYLSGVNIIDLLPPNFILKAPINYNIEDLLKKFKNIVVYFITNFVLIIHLTEKMKIEDASEIVEDLEMMTEKQIQNYEDNKYKNLLNFLDTL
jgi:tRNA/tmRNA/rRNA uracil-C5-methylase (TrmA/RlmC/RlmD family)